MEREWRELFIGQCSLDTTIGLLNNEQATKEVIQSPIEIPSSNQDIYKGLSLLDDQEFQSYLDGTSHWAYTER